MKLIRRIAIGSVVPIALVAWYAIASVVTPNPFFPPIPVVLQRFVDLWVSDRIATDIVPSLTNLGGGYAVAIVIGILVGTILGRIWWLRDLAVPFVNFGRSVPPILIIPPLVLVMGIGDASKIFVIALGATFPIVLTTIDGLRQTDPALVDVSRAMKLGPVRTLRRVYLPAALPSVFGGLQTGLQIALVLMVSSEMIAATRGIGYVTMQAQLTFNAPSVWAGILLLAVLGFLINLLFTALRNRVLDWHIRMSALAQAS